MFAIALCVIPKLSQCPINIYNGSYYNPLRREYFKKGTMARKAENEPYHQMMKSGAATLFCPYNDCVDNKIKVKDI